MLKNQDSLEDYELKIFVGVSAPDCCVRCYGRPYECRAYYYKRFGLTEVQHCILYKEKATKVQHKLTSRMAIESASEDSFDYSIIGIRNVWPVQVDHN